VKWLVELVSSHTIADCRMAGAADMVDKILRGTKPGDIPVEQPTKF
jgi:hypothetical protein